MFEKGGDDYRVTFPNCSLLRFTNLWDDLDCMGFDSGVKDTFPYEQLPKHVQSRVSGIQTLTTI